MSLLKYKQKVVLLAADEITELISQRLSIW